ncbi:hypothetical protein C4J91_5411 [Pseudomonas sp. R3-52-08]|nr:hypothetical protein C4J91_5411 [Pseudomonas sp. R3-52-08]
MPEKRMLQKIGRNRRFEVSMSVIESGICVWNFAKTSIKCPSAGGMSDITCDHKPWFI